MRLTPAAAMSSTVNVAPFNPITTLTGLETDVQTSRIAFEPRESGSIEHVSASLLECLQAANGIVEVRTAMQKVFGAWR